MYDITPDIKEDLSQEEYKRYIEKSRTEQARPERMTEDEIVDFFKDVPF